MKSLDEFDVNGENDRGEVLSSLRAKYYPMVTSGDPLIASTARERLLWLELIAATGGPSVADPAVSNSITTLADRVDQQETELRAVNTDVAELKAFAVATTNEAPAAETSAKAK